MTKEQLFDIKTANIDYEIAKLIKTRWDNISKPLDGLGDFEEVICQIMSILGCNRLDAFKKCTVIMCADNGIVKEGVSQCGQENTYLVAKLLGENVSSASTMAKFVQSDIITVDVGINSDAKIEGVRDCKIKKGTNDFLEQEAMTEEECLKAIEVGINLAKEIKEKSYNIIATGEMGIGNTTTGTALLCALTGINPEDITGRGAGLSDEGLAIKKRVIKEGLAKYNLNQDGGVLRYEALRALSSVGGLDIAALVGLYIGAAQSGIPIIIDGVISASAALSAERMINGCVRFMIPSHSGREAGVEVALNELGLVPYINGNMALGEGCGALMLFQLLDLTLDFFNTATHFEEGNIESYTR